MGFPLPYFILWEKKNQYSLVDMGVLSLIHYSTNPPSTLAFLLTSEISNGKCGLSNLELLF